MYMCREIVLPQSFDRVQVAVCKMVDVGNRANLFACNKFVVYRKIAGGHRRSIFSFLFTGEIKPLGDETMLKYKVTPSLPVWIITIFILLPLVQGVISLCKGESTITFILAGLLVFIVWIALLLWQAKKCIDFFELRLRHG